MASQKHRREAVFFRLPPRCRPSVGVERKSSSYRRLYDSADVEGASGGARTRVKNDLPRFDADGGSGSTVSKSDGRVGNYNAGSLLSLGKGPISADTADKLAESGQASARAKGGQVYLTPSEPKTTAPEYDAPKYDAFSAPKPATAAKPQTGAESARSKRFGDTATDLLFKAASYYPGVKTVLTIDKYTGNTLRNTSSSLIGEGASNAVNVGGTTLDAFGSSTGKQLYDLSDRLYRESQDSLNDALAGKSPFGQAVVKTGVGLGRAGGQAVLNAAAPGLGTGLRTVDEAGRTMREYRYSSGDAYDPAKALGRGGMTVLGVVAGDAFAKDIGGLISDPRLRQAASAGTYALTETAFDEAGRAFTEDGYAPNAKRILKNGMDASAFGYIDAVLQGSALSARDKAVLHDDLTDAQKSCDKALQILADPDATAAEREQAIKACIRVQGCV